MKATKHKSLGGNDRRAKPPSSTRQNTSHAVMAQRVEPSTSLDFFPTPPWATRALCQHILPRVDMGALIRRTAWDCACGEGDMVRPLQECFKKVTGTDCHDYGKGYGTHDFLGADDSGAPDADWIITNPPFNRAEEFVNKALNLARHGVALLVRTTFIEGQGRYERLFSRRPPLVVAQYTERVPMHKGRLVQDGSTTTAYCWLVWLVENYGHDPKLLWIPPCRASLEVGADYSHTPITA